MSKGIFNPASLPAAVVSEANGIFIKMLPIVLVIFINFLVIGVQLPVLPLHLHDTLGMGTTIVGLVVGVQFFAALLSRSWAGNFADIKGTKLAVTMGALLASVSGLVYFVSLIPIVPTGVAVWILVAGRVLLALGESLIITGAMGWGIGLVGPQHAGKVIVWSGIAIFGAYAVGAPIGVAITYCWGFASIAAFATFTPLMTLIVIAKLNVMPPSATARTPFYKVLGAVWIPGVGLALSSIGFGVIMAFIALLFADKHWGSSSLAFTIFGVAFIGARVLFGHLPDKLGGAKVAIVCVIIEALGQFLIWRASSVNIAYLGVALTGFGYSLAFPGFGVEAVRRAPPQTRSLAMGAYVAFLDIALGITTPVIGALAATLSIDIAYLIGALAASLSILAAFVLLKPALK